MMKERLSYLFKVLMWFVKRSLTLDIKVLFIPGWSLSEKISFVLVKYRLIAKHFVKKFTLGEDYVTLLGRKIYYNSRAGIATCQRVFTSHRNLLRIAGVRDAKTVVDIGANVGFFSLLCRELFPGSTIHAVEPVKEIYDCLEKNTEGDDGTVLHNIAVSDSEGTVRMFFDRENVQESHIDSEGEVLVTSKTLDTLKRENGIGTIDVLKIDTETFEAHVLRGAKETLKDTRYLFIEIGMDDNENYTFSSVAKLLSGDGYDFQLAAFRNFADKSEGRMPIMDAVLVNTCLV
ncbi:MAG: FkbM family methyltransferase [Actinobacteria bacterium]|nr:FkbM family methyltransferase [Actinomycetota bacterium]